MRQTSLFHSARALDFVRTVIRGDSRPETSSLLVDLFMVGRMPLDRLDFTDFDRAAADATSGACDKAASAVAAVTTAGCSLLQR
jgi:hypothetical protein